jgi:GNAT superfamily N-acetyltransferase
VSDLRIQLLSPEDLAGFDLAYSIYTDAIVRSEQRTEAELRSLVARPDYRFLVALREEQTVALAVACVPSGEDFWLFEYAAVAPEERGRGIGEQLFLASRLMAGQSRVALVEADAATDGAGDAARRLRFYARLGCRRLRGLDYLLPLETYGAPPPMVLLALEAPNVSVVGIEVVERWLRRIYSDVYGKSLDEPRLARMIDPLPDDVALEAL